MPIDRAPAITSTPKPAMAMALPRVPEKNSTSESTITASE
jgi:hypothetical protein